MRSNFRKYSIQLADSFVRLFSSKYFFYAILGFAVVQGLWYLISFQLSMYDEAIHFGYIKMYTEYLSPFIFEQVPKWDYLGETTRNPNYLFYYLMSWPLRFIALFTDNMVAHVMFLRGICIGLFVTGLVFYRKAFLLAGASKPLVNIVLAFFVLTPGVAILPGVINYDNALILLTGILLYLSVKNIKDKQVSATRLALLLGIGLIGPIIKFTFLAIYAPVFLFLVYDLYKKHKTKLPSRIKVSFLELHRWIRVALVAGLLLAGFLFIERLGINFIAYQNQSASCVEVKSKERCFKSEIVERNITNSEARQAKGEDFQPTNIYNYGLTLWAPHMIRHQASPNSTLPVMGLLYYTFGLLGIGLALLYLREFVRNKSYLLFAIIAGFYALAVLIDNYTAYLSQGVPVAMNGRYLFPILPIIMLFVGLALIKLLGRNKTVLVLVVTALFVAMTQGGGIVTYILDDYESVYWNNNTTTQLNRQAEEILLPLVKN